MPSWLILYATTPVDGLSAAALERELRRADWWTLTEAEGFDAAVAGTLDPRFVETGPDGAFDGVVQYAQGRRPIVLHHWASPEDVAEVRVEALEREPPGEARRYVEGAVEVVGLEMGWSAYDNGGIVVAWEIARLLVRHCNGTAAVQDDDDRWYVLDGWVWRQL